MPHPLRTARPDDPFLRYCLDDAQVLDYLIDDDLVAFIRPGRRAAECWVSALGDDPARVTQLVDELAERHRVDGIHVHDHVYPLLPERLRIADPGHWSIWVITPAAASPRLSDWSTGTEELDPFDARIDPLLAHSESAYLMSGHPAIGRWVGVTEGDRLVAVGAQTVIADGVPHLVSICTDPGARDRGHGRAVTAALLSAAFARGAPEAYLEMYAGNAAAAALYRSVGFQEAGRYRSGWVPGRAPTGDVEPA